MKRIICFISLILVLVLTSCDANNNNFETSNKITDEQGDILVGQWGMCDVSNLTFKAYQVELNKLIKKNGYSFLIPDFSNYNCDVIRQNYKIKVHCLYEDFYDYGFDIKLVKNDFFYVGGYGNISLYEDGIKCDASFSYDFSGDMEIQNYDKDENVITYKKIEHGYEGQFGHCFYYQLYIDGKEFMRCSFESAKNDYEEIKVLEYIKNNLILLK